MGWVALDDGFFANPKILQAGHAAAGLYAMGLAYCGKYATDGFVPKAWLVGQPKKLIAILVEHELWEEVDGGYAYPDYLEYNDDKTAVEARKEQAREAAKARWSKARGIADRNAGSNAQSNAPGNADRTADSNAIHSTVTVQTETRDVLLSKGSRGRKRARLPDEHQLELERIASMVRGSDADSLDVWAHFAADLPFAALAKVRESVELGGKKVGAAYVTRALQSELEERR
jgi:hypothetical protein